MIYGNSSDPVLIKKISLRIWTLRSELEAVIEERMQDNGEGFEKPRLDDLMKEYKSKGTIAAVKEDAVVDGEAGVKDASELGDEGEDEMAKAIAEAEAAESSEESSEETSEETPEETEEENKEEASADLNSNVKQLEIGLEKAEGKNVVKQRIPDIDESKVSVGKAILSEIFMEQMFFFSSKPFLVGQSIVLDFLVPRRFVMNADVTFCRTYNMKSRIISQNRLTYRVGVKFTYLKEGERTILREFTKSIQPDFDAAPVKEVAKEEKAAGAGGGGDDFDIFDDLDD